jgi:hypothetical protein
VLDSVSHVAKPLEAQLAVLRKPYGEPSLEIRVVPHPRQEIDVSSVRHKILDAFYDLKYVVADAPDTFSVVLVPSLSVNRRTQKTPMVIWEDHDHGK